MLDNAPIFRIDRAGDAGEADTPVIPPAAQLNDVDRRIWAEELDPFIPQRVYDVHTHLYRWDFNTDPAKDSGIYGKFIGQDFPVAGWTEINNWDAALLPG